MVLQHQSSVTTTYVVWVAIWEQVDVQELYRTGPTPYLGIMGDMALGVGELPLPLASCILERAKHMLQEFWVSWSPVHEHGRGSSATCLL